MGRLGRTMAGALSAWAICTAAEAAPADIANMILGDADVRAGLCVHVGCGDGTLAVEFGNGGQLLVHGIAEDAASETAARQTIEAQGLYGPVSACRGPLNELMYMDNLVNLLVADDLPADLANGFALGEVVRVLSPNGVAYVGDRTGTMTQTELEQALTDAGITGYTIVSQNGIWAKILKPIPAGMAEWPNSDRTADGGRVSGDTVAGPPGHLQWVDNPQTAIDHYACHYGWVSAEGRVFYVHDDRPPALATPGPYRLFARDAHNGLLLWELDLGFAPNYGRALSAGGGCVYTALASGGNLTALDAATGAVVRDYGVAAREVVYEGGQLFLLVGAASAKDVYCFDAATGAEQWHVSPAAYRRLMVANGKVFFEQSGTSPRDLVCLDATTGGQLWSTPAGEGLGRGFHYSGAVITVRGAGPTYTVDAFADGTGASLWTKSISFAGAHYVSAKVDVFGLGGFVWISEGLDPATQTWEGYDPATGAAQQSVPATEFFGRCGVHTATEKYFITNGTIDFRDWQTGTLYRSRAARASCKVVGPTIANGLVYAFPVECGCTVNLRAAVALAPAGGGGASGGARLETGPAYGTVSGGPLPATDWPTHRHDPNRSGMTTAAVSVGLSQLWEKNIGGRITSSTAANGTVFVASLDAHQVHAYDIQTGNPKWTYTAGGPVDSPPTINGGLCIFGCGDGWVYCLSASTGELAWRYRAAPVDRRIVAYGRLESASQVHGSVLVDQGVACFAAGRHNELDDGITLYGANPDTGNIVWERLLAVDPKDAPYVHNSERTAASVNDVLVKRGDYGYMFRRGVQFQFSDGQPGGVSGPDFRFGRIGMLDGNMKDWWQPQWSRRNGQLILYDANRTFGIIALRDTEVFNYPGGGDYKLFGEFYDANPNWEVTAVPVAMKAMLLAGDTLFVAGPPDVVSPTGGLLRAYVAQDGSMLTEISLGSAPIFDGMAAVPGYIFISTEDGKLLCLKDDGAPRYNISGTVTGEVQAGVTMTLSGDASAVKVTDAGGNYTFFALLDGNYTVTPSLTDCGFTPANQPATVAGANVTGVDFVAAYTSPPSVSFSSASSSQTEADVVVNLDVTMSRTSTDTITVDYNVTAGTATGGGVDYTLASGTLTFAPGETTKQVQLTVGEDALEETDETVVITLSNPVNAQLGANVVHTLTILDDDAPPSGTFETSVAAGSDDAEERPDGSMYLNSSDLELIRDANDQVVGVRFTNVAVPQGATIVTAYVQFTVRTSPSNLNPCTLTVKGEAVDDAATFVSAVNNISSRLTTTASVSWSPPDWTTAGQAGVDQRTPEMSSIIQEVVDRPGWAAGNALAIVITGTGRRHAWAYEGNAAAAALLHIEMPSGPTAPQVQNSAATDVAMTSATLNGQVTSTGGEDPTVIIYWGDDDAGTTAASWDYSIDLGVQAAGAFSSGITGLTADTTYYFRCHATNSAGEAWAPSTASFVTLATATAPSVVNAAASDLSVTSATLNGQVTSTGGEDPTVIIYWGDDDAGTVAANWDNSINMGAQSAGAFNCGITGLSPETTYYFACHASNSGGEAWAPSTESFTTPAGAEPEPFHGTRGGCAAATAVERDAVFAGCLAIVALWLSLCSSRRGGLRGRRDLRA